MMDWAAPVAAVLLAVLVGVVGLFVKKGPTKAEKKLADTLRDERIEHAQEERDREIEHIDKKLDADLAGSPASRIAKAKLVAKRLLRRRGHPVDGPTEGGG